MTTAAVIGCGDVSVVHLRAIENLAGVGVLVEKPVAHTVAEADRLIAAAREHSGVKAGVWIGPREGARSLRLVHRIYRQNS